MSTLFHPWIKLYYIFITIEKKERNLRQKTHKIKISQRHHLGYMNTISFNSNSLQAPVFQSGPIDQHWHDWSLCKVLLSRNKKSST